MTDLAVVTKRINELSETYGLQVHPDSFVWQLAVGEQLLAPRGGQTDVIHV